MGSLPKPSVDGEVGAPWALMGTSESSGSGGFDTSGVDFPAEGLEGLSTVGDSLSTGTFFV
jgi:hypothetical protein